MAAQLRNGAATVRKRVGALTRREISVAAVKVSLANAHGLRATRALNVILCAELRT
jgi:hypothetical protein